MTDEKAFDKIHSLLADGKATQALRHLLDSQTGRLRKEVAWDANHAWYCVGGAYFKLEDFKQAVQAYRKACRVNSQDALALWALGNSYDALARPKLAERAFRLALDQTMNERNKAAVLLNLGNALFDQKRFDEAGSVYLQVKGRRDEIGTKARKNLKKVMELTAI
ncbi:tetratricopeptide repeat protein [Polaromonas sp. YR568]|uniref:tetratricopeptide repeat protein n=1 Tax=Polaromonas sp. YR568 TaxID=1855301 RepID=UPI001114530E|nr:tetratricopeptide repeat protein [Polaromonas sp. YR568]